MRTLVVTVGTDHHPFDRLMTWVSDVALELPSLHVIVQHGSTVPPEGVESHAMLGADDLYALLRRADAVVTHGGPASILDARAAGHRPVVVPREKLFGEHVDDHQVRFVERLSRGREVDVARDEVRFRLAVAAALARGRLAQTLEPASDVSPAVQRFAGLVDQIVGRPVPTPQLPPVVKGS
jgi:UDP-N-acetylglucosamine transferase subunit ALG13